MISKDPMTTQEWTTDRTEKALERFNRIDRETYCICNRIARHIQSNATLAPIAVLAPLCTGYFMLLLLLSDMYVPYSLILSIFLISICSILIYWILTIMNPGYVTIIGESDNFYDDLLMMIPTKQQDNILQKTLTSSISVDNQKHTNINGNNDGSVDSNTKANMIGPSSIIQPVGESLNSSALASSSYFPTTASHHTPMTLHNLANTHKIPNSLISTQHLNNSSQSNQLHNSNKSFIPLLNPKDFVTASKSTTSTTTVTSIVPTIALTALPNLNILTTQSSTPTSEIQKNRYPTMSPSFIHTQTEDKNHISPPMYNNNNSHIHSNNNNNNSNNIHFSSPLPSPPEPTYPSFSSQTTFTPLFSQPINPSTLLSPQSSVIKPHPYTANNCDYNYNNNTDANINSNHTQQQSLHRHHINHISTNSHINNFTHSPISHTSHIEGKVCTNCVNRSPYRSYHCFTCERCVLHRDHHCPFIGKCIGQRNIRLFFQFTLLNFILSIFGMIILVYYFLLYSHRSNISPPKYQDSFSVLVISFMLSCAGIYIFGLLAMRTLYTLMYNVSYQERVLYHTLSKIQQLSDDATITSNSTSSNSNTTQSSQIHKLLLDLNTPKSIQQQIIHGFTTTELEDLQRRKDRLAYTKKLGLIIGTLRNTADYTGLSSSISPIITLFLLFIPPIHDMAHDILLEYDAWMTSKQRYLPLNQLD